MKRNIQNYIWDGIKRDRLVWIGDIHPEASTVYEKRGIDMLLDGYQASPLQIVTAHMVKEAGTYMRDYTMSGDGNIETLRFTDINEHFRAEITP